MVEDDPHVNGRPTAERDVVRVRCPYCGGEHTHHWPEPLRVRDYRMSHCVTKPGGGYFITKVSG